MKIKTIKDYKRKKSVKVVFLCSNMMIEGFSTLSYFKHKKQTTKNLKNSLKQLKTTKINYKQTKASKSKTKNLLVEVKFVI